MHSSKEMTQKELSKWRNTFSKYIVLVIIIIAPMKSSLTNSHSVHISHLCKGVSRTAGWLTLSIPRSQFVVILLTV